MLLKELHNGDSYRINGLVKLVERANAVEMGNWLCGHVNGYLLFSLTY